MSAVRSLEYVMSSAMAENGVGMPANYVPAARYGGTKSPATGEPAEARAAGILAASMTGA